jgi:hypothetical protein
VIRLQGKSKNLLLTHSLPKIIDGTRGDNSEGQVSFVLGTRSVAAMLLTEGQKEFQQ